MLLKSQFLLYVLHQKLLLQTRLLTELWLLKYLYLHNSSKDYFDIWGMRVIIIIILRYSQEIVSLS